MKNILSIVALQITIILSSALNGQSQSLPKGVFSFYNVENLFDTLDTPKIRDAEYTPEGDKKWNTEKYNEKIKHLSVVIHQIGKMGGMQSPDILGLCEVENRGVVEDLSQHPLLENSNYKIVHYDSPDKRGIDVALLYKPSTFVVQHSEAIPFTSQTPPNREKPYFTRDILYVKGKFHENEVHIFVNHWPSRAGGEKRSRPGRNHAAKLLRHKVDSIQTKNNMANIVIMGDFNDDPISPSIKEYLQVKTKMKQVTSGSLYNTTYPHFKNGIGTLAYQDSWNLFDQLIISQPMLQKTNGLHFLKTGVFNKKFIQNPSGNFKGYPYRSYVGDTYQGGYSDHFPVYMIVEFNNAVKSM